MKNTEVIYVKKYYDKLCGLCDLLDENGLWNTPEYAGVKLKDIFRHNLAEYLLYLSASDNFITDEESAMYNEVTGFNGDKNKMISYINENEIYSARFETEVPLIFRLIKECEKNELLQEQPLSINLNKSYSELFADFFLLASNVFIEVDDEVAFPEMEDSNIYMNTIKKYIFKNTNSISEYHNMIDSLVIGN